MGRKANAFFRVMGEGRASVVLLTGGQRGPGITIETVAWRNRVFASIVEEGAESGVFRRVDTEHAAWCFFGMLMPYVLFRPLVEGREKRAAMGEQEVDEIVGAAMMLYMTGLASVPPWRGEGGEAKPSMASVHEERI